MGKHTQKALLIMAGLFILIIGSLWLTDVVREYFAHIVSYSVMDDELVVSKELSTGYPRIHRYPDIVTYDDRDISIQTYKLRGTVKLVNNQAKTGHVGSCAWDVSARFTDAVEVALCGEVEYELSKGDHNIRVLTFGSGKVEIEALVKYALQHGVIICSTMMTAQESYQDKRLAFLGCVENDARSQLSLLSSSGLSFRSFSINNRLEYGHEYQRHIDEQIRALKELTKQQQNLIDEKMKELKAIQPKKGVKNETQSKHSA